MTEVRMWRRSTSAWPVWHLMREDETERAVCGRTPHGAVGRSADPVFPWPVGACMSCNAVYYRLLPWQETE